MWSKTMLMNNKKDVQNHTHINIQLGIIQLQIIIMVNADVCICYKLNGEWRKYIIECTMISKMINDKYTIYNIHLTLKKYLLSYRNNQNISTNNIQ